MMMRWDIDERTARAAAAFPLLQGVCAPSVQDQGCVTDTWTWNKRVVQPPTWKVGLLSSSPAQIMKQFQAERYTQALALVVSWGRLGRTARYIYADGSPPTIQHIEETLRVCVESIRKTQSVAESWEKLTDWAVCKLGWSAVMTSKTLHFLCRSLGFEQNPPVAVDGEWIRNHVWPAFRKRIPHDQLPGDWKDNTFDAYCRYMTAILTWADQKRWTTTQVEATLMDYFEDGGSAAEKCQTKN